MAAKLSNNIPTLSLKIQGGIQAGLLALAKEGEQRIRGEMYEPKHGKVYTGEVIFRMIGGHPVPLEVAGPAFAEGPYPHTASAPGEAPAVFRGPLEESLKAQMTSKNSAAVTSDDPVAVLMEFGTATIAPRPVWARTVEGLAPTAPETVAREVRKAIGT